MKTNLLRYVLLAGLVVLGAPNLRATEEEDLINTLYSSAGAAEKCTACEKLRLVGTVKSVPALAALLVDERTGHAARYALEGMPFPEAVTAMRKALSKTKGLTKAGLIDSLGWRRDTKSVPALKRALSDADVSVASASASALGRIGGKKAIAALGSARGKTPPAVQPVVLESLLECADDLVAAGGAKKAEGLYRSLNIRTVPDRIRVAAWRGIVITDSQGRAEMVASALAGEDRPLRVAALKLIRQLNDATVVAACLRQWATLPADSQLAVLDADFKLGGDVLPAVRTAAQSPRLAVRVAAWQALADLGDASVVPALAKAAAHGEAAEQEAARDTLTRLRGPGVREALLKQLAGAEPKEKVELLLALGERSDTEAASVLLQNAAAESEPVRLAALVALRKIAVADTATPLLSLAAKSKSDAECEPVLKALYAVCQASQDKDQTTRGILDAMKPLSAAERRRVLPVLSELGTPTALEAALAATRDPDLEIVKEAVRVLSQWPNAAPASSLLELARGSADTTLQVLAVRGCVAVAAQEPDSTKRLALLQQAMALAKRTDEKQQALSQIGQIPTQAALEAVMANLDDASLADEAGLAAVTIAEKLAGSNPKLASETAVKVMARCKTPDIVKRAWVIHGKPAGAGPFIRDWLVSGPYRKAGLTGAEAIFKIAFGPEKRGEKVQWKAVPRSDTVDLLAAFPNEMNCAAYLKTQITAPEDCDAALLLGSDDGVKAWLNGKMVHSHNIDRGLVVDQDMAPIRLKKGANELMLKISQGGGGWAVCARIVTPDGQPVAGLHFEPH